MPSSLPVGGTRRMRTRVFGAYGRKTIEYSSVAPGEQFSKCESRKTGANHATPVPPMCAYPAQKKHRDAQSKVSGDSLDGKWRITNASRLIRCRLHVRANRLCALPGLERSAVRNARRCSRVRKIERIDRRRQVSSRAAVHGPHESRARRRLPTRPAHRDEPSWDSAASPPSRNSQQACQLGHSMEAPKAQRVPVFDAHHWALERQNA
jgi:hypothetical protein